MIKIFLAHSSSDKKRFVDFVAKKLKQKSDCYTLWYYDYHFEKGINAMEVILEKLYEADVFVLFISQYSLNSRNVIKEVEKAIKLHQLGQINIIKPISIDATINQNVDKRIPCYLRKDTIKYVKFPHDAVCSIEDCCLKLQSDTIQNY